jgi:DNA-binding MarR family transcriptional regulator
MSARAPGALCNYCIMAHSSRTDARTATSAVVDGLLGASRVLVALAAQSVAQHDPDVTLAQFRSLVVLASHGPQRTSDLAVSLGIAPSTVTRMCDRLVRRGLVQRFRRAGDRRATWVVLTEPGQDLVGKVMRSRRRALTQLVRAASVNDPDAFAKALNLFVEAAGELPERQWWQHWRRSAENPRDAVSA